jgi:hypothetical protein
MSISGASSADQAWLRCHEFEVDFVAYPRTLEDVRGALEKAGIEFIEENDGGGGVRFRKAKR